MLENKCDILIIDPDIENIQRFKDAISGKDWCIIICHHSSQALWYYHQYKPDIVIVEYGNHGMETIELCRQIKALTNHRMIPILMTAAALSDDNINQCMLAKVDDIVFRPYTSILLHAKIIAMLRQAKQSQILYNLTVERHNDIELAEQLFSTVVEQGNIAADQIQIFKRSAATFSGDVQLTAVTPNGDINILLGDFTGHGLSATIGAIPLADTFRTMSKQGYTSFEIMKQINKKMYQLLPTQMYLAVSLVTLSIDEQLAYIWNAGMEDIWVFDSVQGVVKHRIESFHTPLGISMTLKPNIRAKMIPLAVDDRIILYSDGIVDARNEQGDTFGEQRLITAINQGITMEDFQQELVTALECFCHDVGQTDDISIININCDLSLYREFSPTIRRAKATVSNEQKIDDAGSWSWQMSISGHKLAVVNPVPIFINHIQEMEGDEEHWHELYTVLTELFMNALSHGVLGLDSSLKNSPAGFCQYFHEEVSRSQSLSQGIITLKIECTSNDDVGHLDIMIRDSGDGFEFSPWLLDGENSALATNSFSGRGIKLVKKLCQHLSYHERGSMVKARYTWPKK